jgi:glycosyltransferase involved in cell wall biosynthesis
LQDYIRVRKNLRFAQHASLFIANSSYVKEKLVQAGVPEDRVTVLNYFTDISFRPDIKPIPGRILLIGRIAESKGVETLIDAVCSLNKKIDWSLVIAGDGYHMARVKAIVAARGIEDKVNFAGWVSGDPKVRLLHEASVVALPSFWPEAFGIVGIEAMACGRPVVAFDVGGIQDWLEHEVTGYLATPGDTKSLAHGIENILSDSWLRYKLGYQSIRRVEERFRAIHHLKKLTDIYDRFSLK